VSDRDALKTRYLVADILFATAAVSAASVAAWFLFFRAETPPATRVGVGPGGVVLERSF
jgi:hypothetical protein